MVEGEHFLTQSAEKQDKKQKIEKREQKKGDGMQETSELE